MRPRFSVVIPVHDRSDVVGRAVASVLTQTLASVEVVVVGDAPSIDATALATTIGDRRVRLITEDVDGLDEARAVGIRRAKGTWVTTLNPDDEAAPGWLARLGRLADATGAALVSCGGEQHHGGGCLTVVTPPAFDGFGQRIFASLRPGAFAARRSDLVVLLDGHSSPPSLVDLGTELLEVLVVEQRLIVSTPEPLVRWNLDEDAEPCEQNEPELRLSWAQQALDALARTPIPDPEQLARAATVGAIAAVQLGDRREARRLFRLAWQVEHSLRTLARYGVGTIPVVASRVWNLVDPDESARSIDLDDLELGDPDEVGVVELGDLELGDPDGLGGLGERDRADGLVETARSA